MRPVICALLLALTTSAVAQEVTPPPRYVWTGTPCATWHCVIAALAEANGDKTVVALPTRSQIHPWVVLRRMDGGSIYLPEDVPFEIESFSAIGEASARWASIDELLSPMLMTAAKGKSILVVSLKQPDPPRRRVVRH